MNNTQPARADALPELKEKSKDLVEYLDQQARSEFEFVRERFNGYALHVIELWEVIDSRPASAPDAELREALAALVEIDDGNRAAGSHRYEKGSETDKRWRRARKALAKHSAAAEEGHG